MKRILFNSSLYVLLILFLFFLPVILVACDDDSFPIQMTHSHEELEEGTVCEVCGWKKGKIIIDKNSYYTMSNSDTHEIVIEFFGKKIVKEGKYNTWYERYYDNIVGIFILEEVEEIGTQAFFHYEKLKYVRFEQDSNLKYIGSEAFAHCKSLNKIVLPADVKYEASAFYGCIDCWGQNDIDISFEENENNSDNV